MKLKKAAHKTAMRGDITFVETTVAIEFAASCSPFIMSNMNAIAISVKSAQRLICAAAITKPPHYT
jgi:hypothetical protein